MSPRPPFPAMITDSRGHVGTHTSDPRRLADIRPETDARRAVHRALPLFLGRCGQPRASVHGRYQASAGRRPAIIVGGNWSPTPVIGDTALLRGRPWPRY